MIRNILDAVEIKEVLEPKSLATGTNETDIVDMQGYDGVCFVTPITDSADTGVASMFLEQNSSNSDTGMTDLDGLTASATADGDDDLNGKLLIVDCYQPTERYVRANVKSATANIAFGNTIAILYDAKNMPVGDSDTVADSAQAVSPDESTD